MLVVRMAPAYHTVIANESRANCRKLIITHYIYIWRFPPVSHIGGHVSGARVLQPVKGRTKTAGYPGRWPRTRLDMDQDSCADYS